MSPLRSRALRAEPRGRGVFLVCMGSAHRDLRVGPLVVALLWAALWNLWLAPDARAQRGDREGEAQPALPDASRLPPPPFLSPEEAARRFVLEPGWRIDLVAAEPLIEAPVQASFDADGRLWVVEMRGYMPDIDGRGEDAPVGRVSVLFDDDGDGRMDRATRFLEGLVLPRALAFARDGVLVIAPPHVLSCRDIDGDFVADERVVVDSGIEGIASPEYGPNGLLHLRGAWLCANHDRAYAWRDGAWTTLRAAGGGQYGLTRDDAGRVYHNNNSDLLRGNLVDGLVLARNPHLDRGPLVDAAIARDGWKIIFLSQVHPLFPTSLLNYLYGVTRIRFRTCMLWVALGQAPGLFLYAYLGTLAQHGLRIWQGKSHPQTWEYLTWIGGLLLTLAVTTALARIALRVLAEAGEVEKCKAPAARERQPLGCPVDELK